MSAEERTQWYTNKDIYEMVQESNARQAERDRKVDEHFSAVTTALQAVGHNIELLQLKMEPMSKLDARMHEVEKTAQAAHKRLDDMENQDKGKAWVGKSFQTIVATLLTTANLIVLFVHMFKDRR